MKIAAAACVALLGPGCGDDSSGTGGGGGGTSSSSGSTSSTTTGGSTSSTSTTTGSSTTSSTTTGGQGGDGGQGQGGDATGGFGGAGTGGAPSCENIPSTDIPGDECDAVAEALCEAFENCYPFVLTLLTGTKEDCLPWARAECLQNTQQPGDPNSADDYETCAEVAVNAPCGCTDVCGPPSPGAQAVGEACMDDSQCASHACRGSEAYIECGTCIAVVGLGDDCTGEVDCEDGLYCDAGTDLCVTLLENGEVCTDSDECASDVCYEGLCSDPLGLGDDCSGEGGDGACLLLEGNWCKPVDADTSECAPLVLGEEGDECGVISVDPLEIVGCVGNMYCNAEFPDLGVCVPKHDVGDACELIGSDPNQSTCLPHLHCVSDECVVPSVITCE